MTTFSCGGTKKSNNSSVSSVSTKRPAPLAPPRKVEESNPLSATTSAEDDDTQQELLIKVPIVSSSSTSSKVHGYINNDAHLSLLSSSSCSSSTHNNSSNSNNNQFNKGSMSMTTTNKFASSSNSNSSSSSSSSAIDAVTVSKIIKTNCTTTMVSSVSSPSTGSTSSNESVIISTSSSPSSPTAHTTAAYSPTKTNSPRSSVAAVAMAYHHMNETNNFESSHQHSNSFEVDEVIIDLDHREMAIDCPETFTPQFKTRPVYPPIHHQHHKSSCTSTSETTCNSSNNSNLSNNIAIKNNNSSTSSKTSLIKPLLTILNGSSTNNRMTNQPSTRLPAPISVVVENNSNINESAKITTSTTTIAKVADSNVTNPLSISFSSIQFIDDDAKSKSNLNDTSTTLTTPLVSTSNMKENNLLQIELTAPAPSSPNAKPSLGKRLFEKQQQKLNEQFKFGIGGAVNAGFEMDDVVAEEEEKTPQNKHTRAPTPPYLNNHANFSCISIMADNTCGTTSVNVAAPEAELEKCEQQLTTRKQREIINNIDLIEQTLNLKLVHQQQQQQLSSSVDTTHSSALTQTSSSLLLDENFDNVCKSCHNNINFIRKLIKTDNKRNTVDLGYLVLELNERYDLRPSSIAAESSSLVDEIIKLLKSRVQGEDNEESPNHFSMNATELCLLLSRLDIRQLLNSHDQIATRYQTLIDEQQTQNILEHKRFQENKRSNLVTNQKSATKQKRFSNDSDSLDEHLILEPRLVEDEVDGGDDGEVDLSSSSSEAIENSQEGKYLLDKAQHYAVENLKLVNIEKIDDAPLGATIRNRDGSIVISRIVVGGAAQRSGLLHENDEILEINNIPVRGKTINDICDMLCNLQGIVSFLIIPNLDYQMNSGNSSTTNELETIMEEDTATNKSNTISSQIPQQTKHQVLTMSLKDGCNSKIVHMRALFNYTPLEDLYIPCKELGLSFTKGDILHVIMRDDADWWQAYKDDDKEQSLAALIPSQNFQEKRLAQMQILIGDSFMDRKKRERGFCIRNTHKNRRRRRYLQNRISDNTFVDEEVLTYEEVALYRPPTDRKRPIVLIGPHSIGRHELRKRLMQSHPSLFEVAVPHTTRSPRRDEVDGKDYHFEPRHVFEADIKQGRFVEFGEYERNLYGTSHEAIRRVINNGKICVLNLYPQALKTLQSSDLMPYVIYVGPPNLTKLKELKNKLSENYKENDLLDIIDKGREIEEIYGHYFDKIIRNVDMDKTYVELYQTILSVQSEENWVPKKWLEK